MDAFDRLIPDAQDFCRRLSGNNNKAWYDAHKDEYTANLKRPAELLLETLVPRLDQMTGGPVTTKLFRINRDLRFSKGKLPYKDYLHMLWYAPSDGIAPMGWFFGIEKTELRVGAGFMSFDGPALTRWREIMAGPAGDAIADGLATQIAMGASMREATLKRVPAPYPKDHPQGDFLKRKGLALFRTIPTPSEDLPETLMGEFQRFWPAFEPLSHALSR